jgi:hypothetical protein
VGAGGLSGVNQGNRIKINFEEVTSLKTAKPQNLKFKTAKVSETAPRDSITPFAVLHFAVLYFAV